MLRVNEDVAKEWLRRMHCPVPAGGVARDAEATARICRQLDSEVVIKALIPIGRRGLAGGVLAAKDPHGAKEVASRLLGTTINGYPVREVLVERKIRITRELYLSYVMTGEGLEMLVSSQGGVDIESLMATQPGKVLREKINSVKGVTPDFAAEQWAKAGLVEGQLSNLAQLTCRLYAAFIEADALLLELNPIAVTEEASLCIAGAMMSIDQNALFRHDEWAEKSGEETLPGNPREQRVAQANKDIPGGECRYIELDGDIGLLVGGGGAGLYQHDLVLALGGRPANHCVTPPTGSDNRKLRAVIDAILDHPQARALLVGFNYSQMSRVDIRVRTLVEALTEKRIDTRNFPIVIRAFGAGEEDARNLVAAMPNVHYLPRGSSLKDGVQIVVDLAAARHVRSPA